MRLRPVSLAGRAVIVAALLVGCGLKAPPPSPAVAGDRGSEAQAGPTSSPAATPPASPDPPPAAAPASTAPEQPSQTEEPREPAGPRSPSPDGPEDLALPTHGSPPDRPAALWRAARLQADPQARCLWLVDDAGERHAALWPVGHRADLRSAQVTDEQGRVVWPSGEARDIGGGYSSVHVERLPPACRTGARAWWVFLDE